MCPFHLQSASFCKINYVKYKITCKIKKNCNIQYIILMLNTTCKVVIFICHWCLRHVHRKDNSWLPRSACVLKSFHFTTKIWNAKYFQLRDINQPIDTNITSIKVQYWQEIKSRSLRGIRTIPSTSLWSFKVGKQNMLIINWVTNELIVTTPVTLNCDLWPKHL